MFMGCERLHNSGEWTPPYGGNIEFGFSHCTNLTHRFSTLAEAFPHEWNSDRC